MTEPLRKDFEFFEHTADTGLRVTGKTLEELLVNAGRGLVVLLVEQSPITSIETRSISVNASSPEGLLRSWLKELLFWFATDRFLPGDYHLDLVSSTEVRGRVLGERLDPSRHAQGAEVKGITYHQFSVQQTADGWEASVIFDV